PNPASGLGYAIGTVVEDFSANIMEGCYDRASCNKPSATNSMKDKAKVTGGIIQFSKAFDYQSGLSVT
ncbi:MAG: hypothetical protein KBB00_04710, partial [Methanospirillum sp.]|nr:hypothetical protein [Methanospirillum sp.]